MRGSHVIGLVVRIIIAAGIIGLIVWKYDALRNIDIPALVAEKENVWVAVLSIWGVYLLKAVTFVVPAAVVYIAVGMAFSPVIAVLVNAAGILLEVCATYLLGILLGGPYVTHKLEQVRWGEKILALQKRGKLSAVFLLRLIPVFPIDLTGLLLGAVRMRFLPYLGISLAGILPRVILFTLVGNRIYDLIPRQTLTLIAAILVALALIVWVVRYAFKSKKKERNFGKSAYEPLCESDRSVIYDAALGQEADGAGALALLGVLTETYGNRLLCIGNSTSDPYANGAIRAIAAYARLGEPQLAWYTGESLLEDGSDYNRKLTKKYCKYENSAVGAEDAQEVYLKQLRRVPEDGVTFIVTGPLNNIRALLEADEALFNKKVHSIVLQAGAYPKGKEFHAQCDPEALDYVLTHFKKRVVCVGTEVAKSVLTGYYDPPADAEENPVYDAYRLSIDRSRPPYMQESWALAAVQYAFEGDGAYYQLSRPVRIHVEADGEVWTEKDKYTKQHYLIRTADTADLAAHLNDLLAQCGKPVTPAGAPDKPDADTDAAPEPSALPDADGE